MQGVDYTTLVAICHELRTDWVPARVENFFQRDRYTLYIALRTANKRGWMVISWHPQAARLGMDEAPPRTSDTFTFSDQLRHQLNGLALIEIELMADWERVVVMKFAQRPQDPVQWCLMVEIINKYSNVILTTEQHQIVTAAHQVNPQQSRMRSIQTGDRYRLPPKRLTTIPKPEESLSHWRQQIELVPQNICRAMTQTYTGLSSSLVKTLLTAARIDSEARTDALQSQDWQRLFEQWQRWLQALEQQNFQPEGLDKGYCVLGRAVLHLGVGNGAGREPGVIPAHGLSKILRDYYNPLLAQQAFQQLQHQLLQTVQGKLKKLTQKATQFQQKLASIPDAEIFRNQADLLMAYSHQWTTGLSNMTVPDFQTGAPISISLNPELNAIQNAQVLYKRHQKLNRSQAHLSPLLSEVQTEIAYLEQVEDAIAMEEIDPDEVGWLSLQEIREELEQQGYLSPLDHRRSSPPKEITFRTFATPSGAVVWVGRNNHQNDHLTFRVAGKYDLWFHAQEISGSHVLLRLEAGRSPESKDIQFCANLAAYYSRARHSQQVPIVYTRPKYVYKPKGAKPGMAVYQQETIVWGLPHNLDLNSA